VAQLEYMANSYNARNVEPKQNGIIPRVGLMFLEMSASMAITLETRAELIICVALVRWSKPLKEGG